MSLYLSTDSWFNLKRRKSEYQNSGRWEEKYVWEGSWQWWDVVSESYIPIFNNRKPGGNNENYKIRKSSTDMLMRNTKICIGRNNEIELQVFTLVREREEWINTGQVTGFVEAWY